MVSAMWSSIVTKATHFRCLRTCGATTTSMADEEAVGDEEASHTSMEQDIPFKPAVDLPDCQDPKRWSVPRKVYVNTIFMLMVFVNTYISGIYSPGIKAMLHDVPMSREVADLGTGMYMFGIAVGSLLWGPMSQVVGRRPVFLVSLVGMVLFNLGLCLTMHVSGSIICRFFGGAVGATTFSNVAGSIIDMTTERERTPYNTLFRYFTFIGPPCAALLGTVVVRDSTWKWNLRSAPIACFVCLVLYTFTVPETYAPVLIQRKIERDREVYDEKKHHHSWIHRELHHIRHKIPDFALWTMVVSQIAESLPVPWILLFEEPLVIVVTFYTSMLYGLLYGSLLFFPIIWGDVRGYTNVQVAYCYFAVITGFTLSAMMVGLWIQNSEYKRAYDRNQHTPELRIRSGIFSIFFVPIGLFIFGWTAPFLHVHWSGPCIGVLLYTFGMLSVFSSWMTYLTDTYVNNAAAVVCINSFVRCSIAGAFPLFTRQMVHGMTFQGSMSLFGGISIPLTAIGIYIAFHGHRIREKSKHAVYG